MGNKTRIILVGASLAILLISIFSTAIMAAQETMSATGSISYISGAVGFPTGNGGNYKVTSRTVSGEFISGSLSGEYTFTYQANVDLNTQAGNINGNLINGSYQFDITGTSYPVQWAQSSESPSGYIGTSSASGTWQGHGWAGGGTFSTTFSFVPTLDGHIDYVLPDSTFDIQGKWNPK